MSMKVMTYVWQLKLNHTDKLVLLALADNANDDSGLAWPSVKTICKKTCLSERGVQGAAARLSKLGYLKIIERKGHSNHYYVCPDVASLEFRPPHRMHPTPARRAPPPPHGVHPESSSEPSLNHQGISSKSKKGINISSRAIEDGREISNGWDIYQLENLFLNFARQNTPPKNPDKAFLAWIPKFTKGKGP